MPGLIGPHEYIRLEPGVHLRQEAHTRVLETTDDAEVIAWCMKIPSGQYTGRTIAQEEADLPP